jgi:SnoaL-like domain
MSKINSVKIVEDFWTAVWKTPQDVDAINRFVTDGFIITTGGVDIVSKDRFKEWVKQFLEKIVDFKFEVIETFQNEDGSRVASRWRVSMFVDTVSRDRCHSTVCSRPTKF